MEEAKQNATSSQATPATVGVSGRAQSVVRDPNIQLVDSLQLKTSSNLALDSGSSPAPLPQKAMPLESLPEPEANEDPLELPELAPEHLAFLASDRYVESGKIVQSQFALSDDDLSFLSEMDHAVLGGLIDLVQYIVALKGEFKNLNDEEKNRLIGYLLAYRYLPYDAELKPSATEASRSQQIPLPPVPYYRIYSKPMTYRGAAQEVARMAGVEFMGQAQERLRDIIVSRVKGIRTDAQVEEQLMRPQDQGGLGLVEEKSHAAREAINDMIARAHLVTEEAYAEWLNAERQGTHPAKPDAEQVPAPAAVASLDENEAAEIQKIAEGMPKPAREMNTVLDVAVREIAGRLSWKTKDAYLARRLENAISTRLRDVRSRNELFMKLMRDDNVGGLGLDRQEAERVVEDIEAGYKEFRAQIAGEEERMIEMQRIDQEQKIKARKQREAEEHARWYEEKVKAGQTRRAEQKNIFEQFKGYSQGKTSPIHPVEQKDLAKERARFGNLVPAKSVPSEAASTKANPTMRPPETSAIRVSAETARRQEASSGSRPRVEDVARPVASAEKLAGPLQEIGNMTLERFRRLGETPEVVTKRMTDLIALLENESFEKRLAGIQAWKTCPLQKQYLGLIAQSFMTKKSVGDLIAEKQKAGEPVLSAAEVQMIISLNRLLTF